MSPNVSTWCNQTCIPVVRATNSGTPHLDLNDSPKLVSNCIDQSSSTCFTDGADNDVCCFEPDTCCGTAPPHPPYVLKLYLLQKIDLPYHCPQIDSESCGSTITYLSRIEVDGNSNCVIQGINNSYPCTIILLFQTAFKAHQISIQLAQIYLHL